MRVRACLASLSWIRDSEKDSQEQYGYRKAYYDTLNTCQLESQCKYMDICSSTMITPLQNAFYTKSILLQTKVYIVCHIKGDVHVNICADDI